MANFGGYDMPLWYSSVKDEHLAVITGAGLFDTSHMAAVRVTGSAAVDLLQRCFTNDLNACVGAAAKPLTPGRCVYGAFLDRNGHTIDDAIVFCINEVEYLVVVNAGMGGAITNHLLKHANGNDAVLTDLSDHLGKLDIQGPASAKILKKILADPEKTYAGLSYFSFKGYFCEDGSRANEVRLDDGSPVLLSRTGYTGEFGFEIFMAPEKIAQVWGRLLNLGKAEGILPCGLAARDSLRAGAVLPLSQQDINGWLFVNHPWTFALPYTPDGAGFTKDFIGKNALERESKTEFTQVFVGMDPRKIDTHRDTRVINANGKDIGQVLTCVTDMGIGWHNGRVYSIASPGKPEHFKARGLSCGFIKVNQKLDSGEQVTITDNRRSIRVMITDDVRPHRSARQPISAMV